MALDPASGVYGGYVPKSNARVPAKKKKAKPARPNVLRKVVRTPTRSAPIRRTSSRAAISTPRSTPSGGSGKVQKVAKPVSLEDWLKKDSDYQDQLRQFGKTWADFLADVGVRKGRVGTEYDLGRKKMETQRGLDLDNLENDFASRGLLQSGLYGERLGQYEKDYQTNLSDLLRNRDQLIQDIGTEQSNFQREQDLEKERARKAAAQRRTASF